MNFIRHTRRIPIAGWFGLPRRHGTYCWFIALLLLAGCGSTDVEEDPRLYGTDVYQMQEAQIMEYLIGPSDVLSISVWNRDDLNRKVTVRPDGRLSFSLVGDIYAVGLTPTELQQLMETSLSEYINIIPGEVSVVVDEVHSYKVSVLGEVRQPGRFEFQNQVSVLDALAEAGGLTEFASASDILILRPYQGETEKIPFNYKKMVKSKATDDRVLIFPGDIIFVP
jgi:polysaccharide export outer membrane protein